jgi:hypothetical protein
MKSGMLAAEAAFDALTSGAAADTPADLSTYEPALRESWICDELARVRNIRPGCAAPGPASCVGLHHMWGCGTDGSGCIPPALGLTWYTRASAAKPWAPHMYQTS